MVDRRETESAASDGYAQPTKPCQLLSMIVGFILFIVQTKHILCALH
eukprot:SAG31_NODE_32881_length_350_cov_1.390438_1_plen_46_part_01